MLYWQAMAREIPAPVPDFPRVGYRTIREVTELWGKDITSFIQETTQLMDGKHEYGLLFLLRESVGTLTPEQAGTATFAVLTTWRMLDKESPQLPPAFGDENVHVPAVREPEFFALENPELMASIIKASDNAPTGFVYKRFSMLVYEAKREAFLKERQRGLKILAKIPHAEQSEVDEVVDKWLKDELLFSIQTNEMVANRDQGFYEIIIYEYWNCFRNIFTKC